MKFIIVIFMILVIVISIWVLLYPKSELTIRATDIRQMSSTLYYMVKIWANNRLQTHRLRQSLVHRELMLAHSQQFAALSKDSELHELAARAFRKLFVFQNKHKTNIIIPIGSNALADFTQNELDNRLLELLITYYPHHHWQPLETKRLPWTNYFYLTIRQK